MGGGPSITKLSHIVFLWPAETIGPYTRKSEMNKRVSVIAIGVGAVLLLGLTSMSVSASNITSITQTVPEPASLFLLASAIAGVAAKIRKRRKSRQD